MDTISEQVKRQREIEFLTGILTQAGCNPDVAGKASAMLAGEVAENS